MKTIKRLLLILIGLLTAIIVAVLIVAASIDPNDYKQEIEAAAERITGRKLHIAGDIRLTVFPALSFNLEQVSLDNPPGFEGALISAERVLAGLDLLPLLQKRLEIGRVTLQKPQLALYTLSDGRTNWEDLTAENTDASSDQPDDAAPDAMPAIAGFSLAGVSVKGATVIWRDAQTREHIRADAVSLKTGALASGQPTKFSLDGTVSDERRGLSAELALDTTVSADLSNRRVHTKQLVLKTDLRDGDKKPLSITVSTDAAVDLAQGAGTFERLLIAVADVRVEGDGTISGLLSGAPKVNAKIKSNAFDLRALSDTLALPLPDTTDDEAFRKLAVTSDFTADLGSGAAAIRRAEVTLDDSRLNAQGDLAWEPALHAALDVELDRINAGRYLPPDDPAGSAPPRDITVADLRVKIRTDNKKAKVLIPQAKVFGGHFDGALSVEPGAGKPAWRGSGKASGINIGQVLAALAVADEKLLQGAGTLSYELTASGDDERALMQSLAGVVKVELEKGAFKNPALARSVERVIAFFDKRPVEDAGGGLIFNRVSASFALKKGVADNRDLEADMPLLHLRGAGRIDLPRSRIDYRLHAGLLGQEPDRRIYIPIKITGALDDPKYAVDLEKALREEAERQLKRELGKREKQLKEKAKDKIGELLKDKLKLPF